MTVKLTPAQAKALGLDIPSASGRDRRVAPGPYHTRCHTCSEEFRTMASEDRHHAANPEHRRYEVVLP